MKSKEKKNDNFMLYIPHYAEKVEWKKKNGKVILIFHHDKLIEKFIRVFAKKPETTTLELDEMGSTVWNLIDGSRNIYEIGQKVKEKFGDKSEPLYERLIMFIRYLNKRGWIYFSRSMDNDIK